MYRPAKEQKKAEGNYSDTKRAAKHLEPATIQSEASALILFTTLGTKDSRRLKIRLFLSFQISHLTRRVMEREPLRGVLGVEVTLSHQSLVEVVGVHSLGSKS
jgi:hypothetical protein